MLTTLLTLLWGGFAPPPNAAKVQTMLQNLSAPVTEERVLALRQLALLPAEKDAMEPLLTALRDPSPAVRLEAVKTWGKVGNDYDALEQKLLRHQARSMDYDAWPTYRYERHQEWMKRLCTYLKADALDADQNIRRATLRTLALLSWSVSGIMPPISIACGNGMDEYLYFYAGQCRRDVIEANLSLNFSLLQDKNPDVVYAASVKYRGKKHRMLVEPIFRRFLTDKRPEWRAIALSGLASYGYDTDFFMRIMPLFGDPDARIRKAVLFYYQYPHAVEGAGPMDQQEINRALIEEYANGSPAMRCAILDTHTDAALQLLPVALQDAEGEVRAQAIRILDYKASSPSESSLPRPYLLAQLQHPHPAVRAAAGAALWNQQDTQAPDLLLPLLNDPDAEVRDTLIASAWDYQDARITLPLVEALRRSQDKEDCLSGKVGAHLVKLGAPAIPLVRQLLHDDSPHVRLAALEATAELIPEETSALLLDALKDKSPSVRAKAAQLFKAPADETVETALLSLLKDKEAQVRLAVIGKLGEIGGATALAQLSNLSEEEDDEVDEALLQAIQRLKKPE